MMKGTWYYSSKYGTNGSWVEAVLTNREDLYSGTNYSGDGEAQVRRIDDGVDNTMCTGTGSGISAHEYVKCRKTDVNSNHYYQSRGMWTKVYNNSGSSINGSIYSTIE